MLKSSQLETMRESLAEPVVDETTGATHRSQLTKWLALLLLVVMLVPIWLTPHPMFGDYTNHLLTAHIVLEYENPAYNYAAGYTLVPRWYLNSTALSTLFMVGLGQLLPIQIAGRVVLSVYMALFVGGMWLLLQRNDRAWPLLLFAPLLAYNFTFTTGFINFAYGVVLGLYALYLYLRWVDEGRTRDLVWLAFLLLLIYLAHLLAWALWLLAIAAHASAHPWPVRRYGALFVAINGALPLLLVTRPSLAVAGMLIGPGVWIGGWLLRRIRLPWPVIGAGIVGLLFIGYQLRPVVRLPEAALNLVFPAPTYVRFNKLTMPLKFFTIPHQFTPPDDWLTWLNLALLVVVALFMGLLIANIWQSRRNISAEWFHVIGLFLLIYFWFPTGTYDIVFIEPRVLAVLIVVVVIAAPLPRMGTRYWRALATTAVMLGVVSALTLSYATYVHSERVQSWWAQWATLAPTRDILVIYDSNQDARNYPNALRFFTSVYTGHHFANLYGLEHGGFISVTFNNGPLRLNPDFPRPGYWTGFEFDTYVAENCPALRAAYGAVVVLGIAATNEVIAALDVCFPTARQLPNIHIWQQ